MLILQMGLQRGKEPEENPEVDENPKKVGRPKQPKKPRTPAQQKNDRIQSERFKKMHEERKNTLAAKKQESMKSSF